tara:strand:+ start:271 stop:615 length:345 start_codon:yes stop_codon:yes gene_type:complete
MAQNFRRHKSSAPVGTGATAIYTATSSTYNAVVGISLANVHTAAINVSAYVDVGGAGTNLVYLIKDAPLPVGSALQVLDGGAKIVMEDSDILKVKSDIASSLDAYVSVVQEIST